MRRIYFIITLLACMGMFITSCTGKGKQIVTKELSGGWEFRQAGTEKWFPAEVPGCVHTDLLNNKQIEDPFYRMNEKDLQWIDKKDWEYRVVFTPDGSLLKKKHKEIVFRGLDTYADVYLNDSLILKAENMFREWKADISGLLKKGSNEIRIYFHSPIKIGLEKLEKNGYPLPAANDYSEIGGMGDKRVSIFIRKAPYHFGWDWGPRFVTSGIWRPVELQGWDEARMEDLFIRQDHITRKQAEITALVTVYSETDMPAMLSISDNDLKQVLGTREVQLKKGYNTFDIPVKISNPRLWWSHGLGEQKLYTFRGSLMTGNTLLDSRLVKTGLRDIKLVRKKDPDGQGESFYFQLNGVPVFMKGANYIPNDAFLPRVTPEKYEDVVKRAADANMNMLRVWGGGIYENDEFYDLCDKYGILLWHDFMFACSMYPGDNEFLENVRNEAIQNMVRLRNHPSIALWCGNNEIETAWRNWGWQNLYNEEQKKEIWKAYDTLFHKLLPSVVNEYAPGMAYWWSSPTQGLNVTDYNRPNRELYSGDVHMWSVWHGKQPFSLYEKYIGRFMSEYGFQSFPEIKTIESFTLPEDRDITSEVLNWHQRSAPGNMLIKTYLDMYYKPALNFEHFLYLNHVLQAEGVSLAMEAHRRAMSWCMGSLYWQINDCWQAPSWSSTDYFGRWKALHYYARRAFSPLLISPEVKNDSLYVYIVSDSLTDQHGILRISLYHFDGKLLLKREKEVNVPGNTSTVVWTEPMQTFTERGSLHDVFLYAEFITGKSKETERYFYFDAPKNLNLVIPEIKHSVQKKGKVYEITLTTDKPARDVYLNSASCDGWYDDNYFDMLPGMKYKITFYPKNDCSRLDDLRVVSLAGSYVPQGK